MHERRSKINSPRERAAPKSQTHTATLGGLRARTPEGLNFKTAINQNAIKVQQTPCSTMCPIKYTDVRVSMHAPKAPATRRRLKMLFLVKNQAIQKPRAKDFSQFIFSEILWAV